MYARKGKMIGDVMKQVGERLFTVKLFNGPTVHWKAGKKDIELIEFGSFNKENKNYAKNGKVIKKI
jgi:hypothetical protein